VPKMCFARNSVLLYCVTVGWSCSSTECQEVANLECENICVKIQVCPLTVLQDTGFLYLRHDIKHEIRSMK